MQIQLSYLDPSTQPSLRPRLEPPVAIGSSFTTMPNILEGNRVSRITLKHPQIDPYHLLLVEVAGQLHCRAQGATAGIRLNGALISQGIVQSGDRLQVGPCEILVTFAPEAATSGADPEVLDPFRAVPFVDVAQPTPTPPRPTPSPTQTPQEGCDRRVGFLLPRRCGRPSPVGCPYCHNGQLQDDPFFRYSERSLHPDYGNYRAGYWGSGTYNGDDVDFTEADAASLETLGVDFEQDMGAS